MENVACRPGSGQLCGTGEKLAEKHLDVCKIVTQTGFHYVGQAGLELLTLRSTTLASQSAGITGVTHHAWPRYSGGRCERDFASQGTSILLLSGRCGTKWSRHLAVNKSRQDQGSLHSLTDSYQSHLGSSTIKGHLQHVEHIPCRRELVLFRGVGLRSMLLKLGLRRRDSTTPEIGLKGMDEHVTVLNSTSAQ
ncbi:Protein GVQW1 [Plecturocebus cupreus]